MKHCVIPLLCAMICFVSCGHRSHKQSSGPEEQPDSTMQLHYAQGFDIAYFEGYTRVLVYDPWTKDKEMARYYLYKKESTVLPEDGVALRIPIRSLSIASCTHIAFLEMLDALSLVNGVCNASVVYNPRLRKDISEGKVADLGDAFRINREKVLHLRPQAIMVSGYNQNDEHIRALSQSGVVILYNNEWMEQNLLARAEWLRYVACFLDKDSLAASLFGQTQANYLGLKALAEQAKTPKPSILSGDNFRGSWYMPGGRSHQAQLFRDAAASYYFENDSTTGSISCSFEQVVRNFNQADYWIGVSNAFSLKGLLAIDERYTWFKAVRNKQVYAYQGRLTPEGGNDYWESAIVHPDSLLADFIKLFHPELLPGHEWVYINQLQ